jgi:hypothetical protein
MPRLSDYIMGLAAGHAHAIPDLRRNGKLAYDIGYRNGIDQYIEVNDVIALLADDAILQEPTPPGDTN